MADWQTSICLRASRGHQCPYCASRRLAPENTLAKKFPKIARQWHPTKNRSLMPSEVSAHAVQKAWWLCSQCNHSFTTRVNDRSALAHGCSECWKARRSEVMKLACAKLRTPQKLEAKVLKLFQAGISQNEIARQLNLGRNTVHRILVREKNH